MTAYITCHGCGSMVARDEQCPCCTAFPWVALFGLALACLLGLAALS